MSSSHASNIKRTAICYFAPPGIPLAEVWSAALNFLKRTGFASDTYVWQAYRSRRQQSTNIPEELSGPEILDAMKADEAAGFNIQTGRETKRLVLDLSGPYPKLPWQHFSISSQATDARILDASLLIEALACLGNLAIGFVGETHYGTWQRCNDPNYYAEHFGSVDGFRLIHVPAEPPLPARDWLDTGMNPGRLDTINGGPAAVAANMWLGPGFWDYAPCRKEEVLSQSWLKARDTEHFLYLNAYPEPFTQPDGEQGEVQRRLWQLLFHSHCEWPPNKGKIEKP